MKAKTFDRDFEEGKDVTKMLDLDKANRPLQAKKRVNMYFPDWMINRLDKEAKCLGVARQAIIKMWIAERLEQ